MFTPEESQYILNCLDRETKRTGLQNAAFALSIVAKLRIAARSQNADKDESATDAKKE